MHRFVASGLASIALVALPFPSVTRAQDAVTAAVPDDEAARTEEARASFERGLAAYDAGSFEEALVSFERAYELTQNADLLYNIATVADRLRRDDVALDAYERYLAERPETEDRANIEARIAAIRAAHVVPDTALVAPPIVEPASEPPVAPIRRSETDPGAWALIGTGAAVTVAGVVLLSVMAVDLDAAGRAQTWSELSGPYERVPIVSAIGWPLAGVGLALLGAGIGWAVVSTGNEVRASATIRLGPGNLAIEGTF